ncbi:MAG: phosphoribosylformylglycinamidine synthase I [Aigarchaeota archaeon]|nr:phosphoribosylformylglycinamidine synthase I [Aigarchaeota archaeon]MDW8092717.1 phosphoribosylformylglycinamidine synthase I [Nitrososphaerota archaeon]
MNVTILKFPGTNCDRDVAAALERVPGVRREIVWHTQFKRSSTDLLVLPGGFSYSDRLRAGAIAARSPVMDVVRDLIDDGGLVLGICNGFQILVEAGILPGALLPNLSTRFICRWVCLRVENSRTPFTNLFSEGQLISMPIAHNEGRYVSGGSLRELRSKRRIIFTYVGADGKRGEDANPNGSDGAVAGISNDDYNVLGLMPHPERASDPLLSPYGTEHGHTLFLSIANYVRGRA